MYVSLVSQCQFFVFGYVMFALCLLVLGLELFI